MDCTIFGDIYPILIGLQIFWIISILCFLKASIKLNVKVVPADIFKFGGERVNLSQFVVDRAMNFTNSLDPNEQLGLSLRSMLFY